MNSEKHELRADGAPSGKRKRLRRQRSAASCGALDPHYSSRDLDRTVDRRLLYSWARSTSWLAHLSVLIQVLGLACVAGW